MKKKFWKGLRVTVGFIAAIIGFVASVTGIASWLGITSIHLGKVIVPNPIIIVVATFIAILLIAAAFFFGAYSILAVISKMLSRIFSHVFKMTPKEALAKASQASPQAPLSAETIEKEQEQVQTIQK
jgi:type IV secretory pathway VirB3-like protein